MAFHVHTPRPPLSRFVDFFWIYEGYAAPHERERVMPTGTMELVFALDADRGPASLVSGARSEPFVLDTSRPFSVIAVHFRPGGGFPFFGTPAGELHNQTVPLDAVWGATASRIADRLWEVRSPVERFRILEAALLERARGRLEAHPAVRYAVSMFDRCASIPVTTVVDRVGISQRHFVDLFRDEVGCSPKVFCRVRRFNDVLQRIEPLTQVDWTDVALSCGYFDQAHFIHDFRSFAGMTPSAYLRHRVARNHVALAD
jgi:AraC-like DNA-binding protein